MKKKAQLQLTFNWIYILIAGAVILLFFVGIVIRGKAVAETHLEGDILRITDSILVGAGVSEKTKNFIDVGGLSDYTLQFRCEEGYTGFGIKGGAFKELPIEPIFGPGEIKTTKLLLWSLPYKMPYKVMDLLIVTSANTKYFVVGGEGTSFRKELEKAVDGFNFEFVSPEDYDQMDAGKNFQARVIYLSPVDTGDFGNVPASLNGREADRLSAVDLSGGEVVYYRKEKDNPQWVKNNEVSLISLGGEKDAAKYAAMFAEDGESYKCNMMKVFKRMEYVTEVYEGKLGEILGYYAKLGLNQSRCKIILSGQIDNVNQVLGQLGEAVNVCVLGGYKECQDIITYAEKLKKLDEGPLRDGPCIMLY